MQIAIVGTRKATPYGKKIVEEFIHDLASLDVQIVSGLAHGIDKIAHENAILQGLSTVAVLGHGLDSIYPAANKRLSKKMQADGGLISEFLSGTPGDPCNFPKRNRIVAGLCKATVIIESAKAGGSLITARLANDYNRDVFAFPGGVNQPSSAGCNALIRQNKAHLITSAQDLIDYMELNEVKKEETVAPQLDLFESMSKNESKIVSLMQPAMPAHIDDLVAKTKMIADDVYTHLLNLEMREPWFLYPVICIK